MLVVAEATSDTNTLLEGHTAHASAPSCRMTAPTGAHVSNNSQTLPRHTTDAVREAVAPTTPNGSEIDFRSMRSSVRLNPMSGLTYRCQ
jgi:hypothetical protein